MFWVTGVQLTQAGGKERYVFSSDTHSAIAAKATEVRVF
jgi:hypothetical protein